MAKRRAASISSDDDPSTPEGSQVSKRARMEGDGEVNATTSKTRRAPKDKGKGKARRQEETEDNENEDEDEDEDLDQASPDEDEEKKFEEEHEEEIREKLMNKGKTQGGVAEMGIIESLEMHQFMCHKYLTFTFGPQINFIIGHNGSGKSAVLSALTVALGGKATSTGRGSGLKSFIREGQHAAEVTVVLKNLGDEAYRPKEYGKSIVITRKFTKEGSSSYKIKSKDGRVISTKREELSAICDHMNIQVDNPMNILTQDAARQFLSASQPADKYKFFLRGTQLSQLSEEYQTCLENIGQTQKVMKRKSESIPELEEQLEEAKARLEEAKKAREQRHKIDELKKEMAWAHVAAKEAELKKQCEEVAKLKHRIPKVQQDVDKHDAAFIQATREVEAFEMDLTELGDRENLDAEKNALQAHMKENRTKISKYKADEKQMSENLSRIRTTIADLEERIQKEEARANTQGKRDETARRLEEAHIAYGEAERRLESITAEKTQKQAEQQEVHRKGNKMNEDRETLRQRMNDCQGQLARCAERERNKLAPFGNQMDQVLQDIQRTQWFGNKPVGPLGMYVNVKDPQQWAALFRVTLGSLMSAFAITDPRDRATLHNLLGRYRNNPQIIISEVDLFDYSRGEPPPEIPTMLRALDVSEEYVLRILVNNAHIENTVIAPTRRELDNILSQIGRGTGFSADLYRVQRFEGGGSSSPLNQLRRDDARHQLFTGDSPDAARIRWQGELDNANRQVEALNRDLQQERQKYDALGREIKSLSDQEVRTNQELRSLKTARDALQEEANEAMPVEIQAFKDAIAEANDERESIISQFKAIERSRAELDTIQRSLQTELDSKKAKIRDFEGRREDITKRAQDVAQRRINAQHDKAHYLKKLEEEKRKVADAEAVADNLAEEFKNWTVKAEQYCGSERFPNPRPVEEVQRMLEGVQAALREREKRQGASVDDLSNEVNKRQAALELSKKEYKNMVVLVKALKKSLRSRLAKWHEFRRYIALRCKVYFQYHLSNRGYYGKVLFDHPRGTLTLKVQTDDQTLTQNNREKDPRSLSGGEKSFSTICLLLSLWESIGCPIRCLDEFDVFMDAVNRRISMKMMIDTANASDCKQYVLITPQDMTNVQFGNTVRVHRMSDPERGQGVLSF
ncbi:P-loop containing nucleoside triphosphate hydrolase protein [Laetiporus sulphureus 93-53]|uniref:p-loop containing nucleoside triphosphate hydrolase protein n=1 Tax=Laetiporus sulphureus 93-53 TaxID=1314785 RepID=A0A165FQF3_9APHY|nr:P-loop containing nucleoside triphosphate hydrolase protein [Laetiporus sulphureus 93-53]KZT09323.1 P-loop containing nucleoside triphosphate hydrolase protein [Laetiporus sulphureus 93-53]